MIVLSFPRSGRTWLQLQLIYYAIPNAVNLHPLNALQLINTACYVLGKRIVFMHGEYHLTDTPRPIQADIVLTRNFEDIQKSYKPLWGHVERQRYDRMILDNQEAPKLAYEDRLANPEKTFCQFLHICGIDIGDVTLAIEAASKHNLMKYKGLSYVAGRTFAKT